MKKYQPYQPTKWEERIDKAFGLLAPKAALNRMVNREKANWFRYLAAQPTTARRNSPSTTAGEWLKIQREKLQVMWNAIMMVSNSGLCTGILTKFPTYVCGTLGWQARTGDKSVNEAYQNYIRIKCSHPANIDITRRHTLRQMCMLDVKCIALKGDVGTNIVRGDDGEIYLQGIEADRIGDPYRWETADKYVRGLELDELGGIKAVRVYHQDRRSGLYKYDDTFPTRDPDTGLPTFLFFTNPIDFDNYRGISLFQHAIDNSTYIDRMRQYELQALLWAASQSGVYYTKSGALPEALPFARTPITDKDGNIIDTYEVRPNTVTALSADGEKIEMFQHDRPSPNVIGMYENTVRDIAIGAGLTYGFCYDMTGLTGPAVRQCSAQDSRAIQIWQNMLKEQKLDYVVMLLLGNAIANGELPYHDNWLMWDWFFPPKPTIDVGRESDANIQEINQGINTGANVVAEAGLGDIQDVITQRSHEVEMMIEAAQDVAQRMGLQWEQVYALMIPPPKGRAGGGGGLKGAAGAAAGFLQDQQNRDQEGATDDGVEMDEEPAGRNGQRYSQQPYVVQHFYRPDQTRDESGKWTDEGKGSQEAGYVHPGEGGGTAVKEAPAATQKKTESEPSDIDRQITDYKPDRSLADPSKTVSITSVAPNTSYTPYSKTPFFDQINKLQGSTVDDKPPLSHGVADYVEQRRLLFETIPPTKVALKDVVVTQEKVNGDRVKQLVDDPATGGTKPIYVVKQGGKLYIVNGHHRIAADLQRGTKEIDAHLLDLDHPEPSAPKTDAEAAAYVQKLHEMPSYRSVVDRLRSLGATNGEREAWSLRQHTGPDGKLTPERQAEHETIIGNFFNPKAAVPEGQRPKAIFLIGKPAAGKTRALDARRAEFGEVTEIGADSLRSGLSDYRGWNAAATQIESKIMSTELAERAAADRHNVVFDETGGNLNKTVARAKELSKTYDVHVIHVDSPLYQTMQRSWKRFEGEGRFVEPDYQLNDVDDKPINTYKALRDSGFVKSWQDIDNTSFKGIVREQGSR